MSHQASGTRFGLVAFAFPRVMDRLTVLRREINQTRSALRSILPTGVAEDGVAGDVEWIFW